MARCKLTNMNLRNIRKTREYQCLLIDLVKTGVVGKSAAEGLLGYTIPEGLLGDTTPVTPPDEDEEEHRFITIAAAVLEDDSNHYETIAYDLNDGDTAEDVLAAANDHWPDGNVLGKHFNAVNSCVESDEGNITIGDKLYAAVDSPVDSFEQGAVYEVYYDFALDGDLKPGGRG